MFTYLSYAVRSINLSAYPPTDVHPALERTYLAYIRTGNAFATLGIAIDQLFRLHGASRATGAVFGSLCTALGIVITIIGCLRYFRQQRQIMHWGALGGGFDMVTIAGMLLLVSIMHQMSGYDS